MRHALIACALLATALAACGRGGGGATSSATTPAASASAASASAGASAGGQSATATVGDVTLQASTLATADLNPDVAARYGIDRAQEGVLLLVTVRDAAGNAIDPGDLRVTATASALPDPPAPLPLRAIETNGMTDYIGVLAARAPASVQFRITAIRDGSRSEIATTADLQPR